MKLYVGNLSYSVTDEDLRTAFAAYGQVASAEAVKAMASAAAVAKSLPAPKGK